MSYQINIPVNRGTLALEIVSHAKILEFLTSINPALLALIFWIVAVGGRIGVACALY
jgi:hypothetical protein